MFKLGDAVVISDSADVSPQIRGRSGRIVETNGSLHGNAVTTAVLVEIDGPTPKAGARWYVSICCLRK